MDLNELELSNIADWPVAVKAGVITAISVLAGVAWYYLVTSEQLARLSRVEAEEQELRTSFESKQRKAASLDQYREQLEQMEESFGAMVRQLPDQTEVAALLVEVSQTGLAAGLEFELFQPTGESKKDFYAELPIRIRVLGDYHQFGRFASGLAALPRIVTIHNVAIGPRGRDGEGEAGRLMSLDATVKTYRYLDETAR